MTLVLFLLLTGSPLSAGDTRTASIAVNGSARSFRYYVPGKPAEKPALVLILHGGGGTAKHMEEKLTVSAFNKLADKDGFIAVYPEGVDKHWNDGRAAGNKTGRKGADDVGFISSLIDFFGANYKTDGKKVFATGISNGAIMSFTLACGLSDKIAAIAPVAGAMSEKIFSSCAPARPVSVLMINGTDDNLVHWGGGDVTGPFGGRKLGRAISVTGSFNFWAGKNRCAKKGAQIFRINNDKKDGTGIEGTIYSCQDGVRTALYKINGGGHAWPGGAQYLPKWLIGRTSTEVDAAGLIWRFFKGEELP
ncbi:MAG: hypothetical protein NTX59_01775 [Elusimicrobia bacterium]|nr:hypothetical protein [Elusimicrobiota bacterium]